MNWILFLDDDIEPVDNLLEIYLDSISKYGNDSPGFVGVTMFPSAMNNFTKGIIASQILTFFDLAKKVEKMPWGVTANLLVNRNIIGDIRFRNTFPKAGGGEDVTGESVGLQEQLDAAVGKQDFKTAASLRRRQLALEHRQMMAMLEEKLVQFELGK